MNLPTPPSHARAVGTRARSVYSHGGMQGATSPRVGDGPAAPAQPGPSAPQQASSAASPQQAQAAQGAAEGTKPPLTVSSPGLNFVLFKVPTLRTQATAINSTNGAQPRLPITAGQLPTLGLLAVKQAPALPCTPQNYFGTLSLLSPWGPCGRKSAHPCCRATLTCKVRDGSEVCRSPAGRPNHCGVRHPPRRVQLWREHAGLFHHLLHVLLECPPHGRVLQPLHNR